MENKKETSRRLIFLEPVNNYTDTEDLVEILGLWDKKVKLSESRLNPKRRSIQNSS